MTMKKRFTVFMTILLIPFLMVAQKESPVKLGLRIAPSISWLSPGTEGYDSEGIRAGISGGLVTDFFFAKNYAISTGFSIDFPSGMPSPETIIGAPHTSS